VTEATLIEIPMPRLSDQGEEATVIKWLKQPGDSVGRGEPLVEIETDKATMVYEAEFEGVLEEIVVDEGTTAALGQTIARASSAGAAGDSPLGTVPTEPAGDSPSDEPVRDSPPGTIPAENGGKPGRHRATPVARRLAAELGVSLEGMSGTGPGGRIVRADVRDAAPADASPSSEDEVELTPTQRTIAQRMTESRARIPEFTLEAEIDMEAAAEAREELRTLGREPLPSFNDLVVKAAALALRRHPALNSSWADGRIRRHRHVNVGIAVATDDALYVPTLPDADELPIFELAALARDRIDKVLAGTIASAELGDGTFTVSNLGMFGIRRFHAVINPPQAAILAVGEVSRRPVVGEDGAIVARHRMDVALSCDHRVVYGAQAAQFLQTLTTLLERPMALVAA
jgi:pyruvate dehydrogenase E2 component (dihydrolipoamide acetyltransferase)